MIKISIEKVKSFSNKVLTSKAVSDAEASLSNYDFNKINIKPKTSAELYGYYNSQFRCLLDYATNVIGEVPFVLSNEIRAMLGHLVDYSLDSKQGKINLEKAYGHFRRLNLDTLKLLCDMFDKFFDRYLRKHIKYDYSKVAPDFIQNFAKLFFSARSKYLSAQSNEELGSNSGLNVYQSYFDALNGYIELKKEYVKNYKQVGFRKARIIAGKIASVVVSLSCSVASLITLF